MGNNTTDGNSTRNTRRPMPKHATRTSFRPGVVTNPKGRPPTEMTLVGQLKIQLARAVREGELDPEDYEQKVTFLEAFTKKVLKKASTTDDPLPYWREFKNAIDGMPKQSTELTGANGSDLFDKVTFKITND